MPSGLSPEDSVALVKEYIDAWVKEKLVQSGPQYVDKAVSGYRYLMVILEHKDRRTMNETQDERAAARMMLVNQRKREFIENHVNLLYEKALKDGAIIQ